ncbi:hypothetical protein DD577_29085 [Klebsiella pneumoniae]|nr:hypothetical protein DD577_29085 [Klebsiella pneumoniae]
MSKIISNLPANTLIFFPLYITHVAKEVLKFGIFAKNCKSDGNYEDKMDRTCTTHEENAEFRKLGWNRLIVRPRYRRKDNIRM